MYFRSFLAALAVPVLASVQISGQVTTPGFLNQAQSEPPGTLLSHPVINDSEPIGRTTSINYLNGWVIVGGEAPGSRPGSDLELRVYDIADPTAPVRRMPSDFGLSYPNNSWVQGNYGWNAHGTAQSGNLLLPDPIRVDGFGGLVERRGSNGVPYINNLPLWYNRSSQAGPWSGTLVWYGTHEGDFDIAKVEVNEFGFNERRVLATFDHAGQFGGGEWHPIFFGDLLIYARSGGAAADGVVVYRLSYQNMDDADPANDAVTPTLVGSLSGGFQGYWPNLFSDGTGLYVIGSTTDILIGADITSATLPGTTPDLQTVATLNVSNFTNASYPTYQDQFAFIHDRKIDMTRFLAGDANPIVLDLDEDNPPRPAGAPALPPGALEGVNTSQMSLALGNLWLTGGYPIPGYNQGLGVWVHQQEPDTTAPRVSFHIPQAGRTNYPRHAPLSFLLHEHPRNGGPRNGIDFAVRAVGNDDSLGTPVDGFLIHDFSGNLTFTPDVPLNEATTYQVDFFSDPGTEVGFRDAAGNYIEPYSFRFSTGGGINATAPPEITDLTASNFQPAPGESVTIVATASGTAPLEYRFNDGDGWTTWSSSASATISYASPGRPRVLAQVRDADGNLALDSLKLLVIDAPPTGPRPTQSSPLTIGDDSGGRHVWGVNPDANTVTVIDAATGAMVAEHPVGLDPRNIARDANGRYWVSCHDSDELMVMNDDGSLHATISLDYGSAPFGVVASPDGTWLYVSMYGSGELHRYQASAPGSPPVVTNGLDTPRAMAVSADGSRVFVTRFISPRLQGHITEFDATLGFTRQITLASSSSSDGGDRAAGTPNYLAGIAISPDGTRAAVVSKQDNVQRGEFFGVGDLTHETTVRSVISFIDLTTHAEIPNSRRDFDNSGNPSAVAYTPLGDTILVAHEGNNRVAGIDAFNLAPLTGGSVGGSMLTQPALITLDLSTGRAPQGLLIDDDSQRLFSQDFMGRSITVRDAAPLLDENRNTLPLIATTNTVGTELLDPQVLEGKRIFYNAADPRMAADSYISCASCHADGGHDGRVWDFTGRGEGFRRTTDLRGRTGTGHGVVHWSGNFDEIQDFEHDIRGPFGGTGFLDLTAQEFAEQHPGPASGKAGLNAELDALAAYVTSLGYTHVPRSPSREPDGSLSAAGVRGQGVFLAQNCASCHSGPDLTSRVLVDVGTQSLLSGSRLGEELPGIDTPTLHGLHATRLYLHHGQVDTLGEVFDYAGGTYLHASSGELLGGATTSTDDPSQGAGGFARGYFGASAASLNGIGSGLRFSEVDGGSGGDGQIRIRYLKNYNSRQAVLRVNGVDQTFDILRQQPDNGWQSSGWREVTLDITLNPGPTNTIEILRSEDDFQVNSVLVSNADDLEATAAHRVVRTLPEADQDDLIAYILEQDGTDAAGTALQAPSPLPSQAPAILVGPIGGTFGVGNPLRMSVATEGTGPFSYEWRRGTTIVGTDSATLEIPSLALGDAGSYTVTISNALGDATSAPAEVIVNPPLAITTAALPDAVVGVPYTTMLETTGGVATAVWSIDSGALPLGLVLTPGGQIQGKAVAPAEASIGLRASDPSGSDVVSLTLRVVPVAGLSADPDLILHYTFDEGAGTMVWDSSPQGNNHSTNVSGAHWVEDGRFGGAYGPGDASQDVFAFITENQGDLDFDSRGDEFTISIWARSSSGAGYRTLLGQGRTEEPWDTERRLWTTSGPGFLAGIQGGQYGPGYALGGSPMNDGQWHLVTMVNEEIDGTWMTRIYHNGSLLGEFPSGASESVPAILRVGDTARRYNNWRGHLDDLRIYRRALGPAEIAALYTQPDVQTYDEWEQTFLTQAQQANPELGGPSGDANRNGIPNAVEFALDNPTNTPLTVRRSGNDVELTFDRNSLARGHELSIRFTTDMLEWSTLAIGYNGQLPDGPAVTASETGDLIRNVTLLHPDPGPFGFYQLQVTIPQTPSP